MSDLNEAPHGPSTEEPVSDNLTTETPEQDEYSAAFDRLTAGGVEDEAPEAEEEVSAPEAPAEPEEAPKSEAPPHLPYELRQSWDKIPPEQGKVFADHYKDISDKYSSAQRTVNDMKPVLESLSAAAKHNPAIKDMKPAEIASQIPMLVEIGQRLNKDPIGTVFEIAQRRGFLNDLAAALTGQQPKGNEYALQQKIEALEGRIADLTSPEKQREMYSSFHRETTAEEVVSNFAAEAEHWADVEPHLELTLPIAKQKLGSSAPARAVLEAAYNMAIEQFLPDRAPKPEVAAQAAPEPDPAKVQKAVNAKSVNVTGQSSGKSRPLTEAEEYEAAWRRATNR